MYTKLSKFMHLSQLGCFFFSRKMVHQKQFIKETPHKNYRKSSENQWLVQMYFLLNQSLFFGDIRSFSGGVSVGIQFSWCQQPLSGNGQVILAVQCLLVNMLVLNRQMRVINLHLQDFRSPFQQNDSLGVGVILFFTPRYEAEHLPKRKGETKMGPMGCWWWFFQT